MIDSYLDSQPGRIFHPHDKREEFKSKMWGRVDNRATYIEEAIQFTGDAELYGGWMLKVLDEWPLSSEHNLSFRGHNRRAWIGHAACALAIGCPEDIVREAWGILSVKQQRDANAAADKAIAEWERRYGWGRETDPRQGGLFGA